MNVTNEKVKAFKTFTFSSQKDAQNEKNFPAAPFFECLPERTLSNGRPPNRKRLG